MMTTLTKATTNVSSYSNPNKDNDDCDHDSHEIVPVRSKRKPTTLSSSSNPPLPVVLCQMCRTQPRQYTCPRCSIHTCSLSCCLVHKTNFHCNGRRDITKYMPLSQMNDTLLQSDYHFLQNGTTTMDTTRRIWDQMTMTDDNNNNNNNNNAGMKHPPPPTDNKKRSRTETHWNHSTTSSSFPTQPPSSSHPLLQAAATVTTSTNTTTMMTHHINILPHDRMEPERPGTTSHSGSDTITNMTPTCNDNNDTSQNLTVSASINDKSQEPQQPPQHYYHHHQQQQQQYPPRHFQHPRNNNNKHIPFTSQSLSQFNQIKLLILPNIMERHQMNQSYYLTNIKSPSATTGPVLHWTMEICFVTTSSSLPLDGNNKKSIEAHSGGKPTLPLTAAKRNDESCNTVVTILLHSIPETITLQELQKQATRQWHDQEKHQPHRIHRSNIPFPIVAADHNDDIVQSNIGNINNDRDTTFIWWMKQIPCPAHHPTYIPIATTIAPIDHVTTIPDIDNDDSKVHAQSHDEPKVNTTPPPTTTLTDVLRNRTVIEFPTIYIISQTDYESNTKSIRSK